MDYVEPIVHVCHERHEEQLFLLGYLPGVGGAYNEPRTLVRGYPVPLDQPRSEPLRNGGRQSVLGAREHPASAVVEEQNGSG